MIDHERYLQTPRISGSLNGMALGKMIIRRTLKKMMSPDYINSWVKKVKA